MNVLNVFKKCAGLWVALIAVSAFAQYDPCNIPAGHYCTYTIGGWRQSCNGQNVGCLRDNNFAAVYPSGLTVGVGFNAHYSTSANVRDHFPTTGPSGIWSQNYSDQTPGGGTFAAQLVGAKISRDFSAAGVHGSGNIGHLVFHSGQFQGVSVDSMIHLAEEVIGGTIPLPNGVTISNLNDALTDINETFDGCTAADSSLVEPGCLQSACDVQAPFMINLHDHFCIRLTEPVRVYWCTTLTGQPHFAWTAGCNNDFCSQPTCEPFSGDITYVVHIDSAGGSCQGVWWSAVFTPSDNHTGCCACVYFDNQLAVELTAFTAIAGNNEVNLEWTTASERENDHFNIERADNGTNWSQIGVVAGQGTSNIATHYSFSDRNVSNGVTYSYRLVSVDMNGLVAVIGNEVTATPSVNGAIPTAYALHQNYPNPFNPNTTISFDIPEAGHVTLTVFDINGREIATLVNGDLAARSYSVSFDASGLASGTYFYRIQAGSFSALQKMLLLK